MSGTLDLFQRAVFIGMISILRPVGTCWQDIAAVDYLHARTLLESTANQR